VETALAIFQSGGFDAVCSDDKRFIRLLRALGIPHITPAVCVFLLLKQGKINLADAVEKLELLRPFIRSDEYHTVIDDFPVHFSSPAAKRIIISSWLTAFSGSNVRMRSLATAPC
jgi:hypothetical protein